MFKNVPDAMCKHEHKEPPARTERSFLSYWHRWQDGGQFTWMATDIGHCINQKIQRIQSENFF